MTTGWEPPEIEDDVTEGPVDKDDEAAREIDWGGLQRDPAVIAEGERLGQTIDINDDDDNGDIPLDKPKRGRGVLPPVDAKGGRW